MVSGNTRNDQSLYFLIYRVYFVHSFVGAFESLLESPLNVGFLFTHGKKFCTVALKCLEGGGFDPL